MTEPMYPHAQPPPEKEVVTLEDTEKLYDAAIRQLDPHEQAEEGEALDMTATKIFSSVSEAVTEYAARFLNNEPDGVANFFVLAEAFGDLSLAVQANSCTRSSGSTHHLLDTACKVAGLAIVVGLQGDAALAMGHDYMHSTIGMKETRTNQFMLRAKHYRVIEMIGSGMMPLPDGWPALSKTDDDDESEGDNLNPFEDRRPDPNTNPDKENDR